MISKQIYISLRRGTESHKYKEQFCPQDRAKRLRFETCRVDGATPTFQVPLKQAPSDEGSGARKSTCRRQLVPSLGDGQRPFRKCPGRLGQKSTKMCPEPTPPEQLRFTYGLGGVFTDSIFQNLKFGLVALSITSNRADQAQIRPKCVHGLLLSNDNSSLPASGS